ncbi:methyltransferase [Arthrobacter dokdonensis]|uniref:methyltransferase n=1 Tax=Arthrobacter dokdonellae TaxID=2211210 RepID=UPI000DE58F97|nr:methyltransferase [Arthrobacter dokdonellae]
MTDHATHQHPAPHTHQHDAGLPALLDLDAQVLGDYLDGAAAWSAGLVHRAGTIVDIGSGTGAGTVALARRFPAAELLAVDRSPDMVARTLGAARSAGVAGRVRAVEADLDRAWPALGGVDLIWASSSLHELADPQRAMRDIFAALNPGGLAVVVEMDGLPRFLPDSFHGGLEPRLHALLARRGWNAHPDWQPGLERAGFADVQRRAFPTEGRPAPELAARYARAFLARMGPALEGVAAAGDLAALRRVLADRGTDSPLGGPGTVVRGGRTAWAARKP